MAVVSGGQVQIRWAGLAWRWPNAKPNLTSGTKLLVNIARNAKLSLPIMILPENAKPQESAHQESAHQEPTYIEPACVTCTHQTDACWELKCNIYSTCWYKDILSQNWQKKKLWWAGSALKALTSQAFSQQPTKHEKNWWREKNVHTSVDISQLKCPVYAVFVAKMAFARFDGQV